MTDGVLLRESLTEPDLDRYSWYVVTVIKKTKLNKKLFSYIVFFKK